MQPIKITAVMQDGRIAGTDPWFPLDSILGAAWMRKHHPDAFYNASSHMLKHDLIVPELPFDRRETDDDWYWACSFNTIQPLTEYVLHWHKRFDDTLEQHIDFGKRRGRINVKSAEYKAYRMPLVIQLFNRLEWYAVGEIKAIRKLCGDITHIGKKSSQGLGAIDYWLVEEWPEDWSTHRDGKLTRSIPSELLLEGVCRTHMAQYGIRPPYWHNDNQRICCMPESNADG